MQAIRIGNEGSVFGRSDVAEDDRQDHEQDRDGDQVEPGKDSLRKWQSVSGDLLDDVERGAVGVLRKCDRAGEALGGNDEAAIGGGDEPAEVDAYALGDFAREQGRSDEAEPPVEPGSDQANEDGKGHRAGASLGDRCDPFERSVDDRRGGQRVAGDEHDHHLECEREDGEDAAIPGRGNANRSAVRRELPRQQCAEEGEQHRKNEGVRHEVLEEIHEERGHAGEKRLLLR